MYRCCKALGGEENIQECLGYLEVAFEMGNPEVIYQKGCLSLNGDCVEQNESDAVKYFKLATVGGSSGAMLKLGRLYRSGNVVAKDKQKGLELSQKSANLNNLAAINRLVAMYNLRHSNRAQRQTFTEF
ncbi:hypothetical protein GEMRC1_009731 [Eukaryota sp. GEM-RC1]